MLEVKWTCDHCETTCLGSRIAVQAYIDAMPSGWSSLLVEGRHKHFCSPDCRCKWEEIHPARAMPDETVFESIAGGLKREVVTEYQSNAIGVVVPSAYEDDRGGRPGLDGDTMLGAPREAAEKMSGA